MHTSEIDANRWLKWIDHHRCQQLPAVFHCVPLRQLLIFSEWHCLNWSCMAQQSKECLDMNKQTKIAVITWHVPLRDLKWSTSSMLIIKFLGFIDLNKMITSSTFFQEKAEHELVGHVRMLVCSTHCVHIIVSVKNAWLRDVWILKGKIFYKA